MRILVDTNIFLDVLMARPKWLRGSRSVLDWCDAHPGEGWIAWHTLSNRCYIGAKTVGKDAARKQIEKILKVFKVSSGDSASAQQALRLGMQDFEDALQVVSAQNCSAQAKKGRGLFSLTGDGH